jgi:hypothetical protein
VSLAVLIIMTLKVDQDQGLQADVAEVANTHEAIGADPQLTPREAAKAARAEAAHQVNTITIGEPHIGAGIAKGPR